ncbi:MAG: maleylacetoacetate isomerase [Pseudomonadota bacterium]|nr:maleylacetoacetate isomerase [Pseudomonadota bacterium]
MKIFGYFRSSAAFRLRIAMNFKGLNYDYNLVNLQSGDHLREDFKRINPQGRVPAIDIEGNILTQSLAIIEYLDEVYPTPPLLPSDPLGKAKVRGIAGLIACDIHPLNNLAVLNYLRDQLTAEEEARLAWYRHWVKEGFDGLELMLSANVETGQFCFGDTPTVADICLVPQVVNAKRFNCNLACYPTITRIFKECMDLSQFADADPMNQPEAAELA